MDGNRLPNDVAVSLRFASEAGAESAPIATQQQYQQQQQRRVARSRDPRAQELGLVQVLKHTLHCDGSSRLRRKLAGRKSHDTIGTFAEPFFRPGPGPRFSDMVILRKGDTSFDQLLLSDATIKLSFTPDTLRDPAVRDCPSNARKSHLVTESPVFGIACHSFDFHRIEHVEFAESEACEAAHAPPARSSRGDSRRNDRGERRQYGRRVQGSVDRSDQLCAALVSDSERLF